MKKFIETILNIYNIEELRGRIITTMTLLLVYRLGAQVVLPGIDSVQLAELSNRTDGGGLLGILNAFTGGAFANASVFALGIMPYISASIVVQLMGIAVPYLQKLQKEGESGNRKRTQITRWLTILICVVQAPAYLYGLSALGVPDSAFVLGRGPLFMFSSVIILVTGTIFAMWLGEKITDIELFQPDRLANRILGMGDVVSLVEKAQQDLSEEKIKETEEELKKGIFTMDSYLAQLRQMKKMGGMEGVMSMLPGVNKMKAKMDQANIDEKMLVENEAIILSMTKKERENPKIISGSRRKRISKGAGVDVSKINKLLKQFKMMSDMMKKMSQGKKIPSGMIPDEMLNQLK